MILAMKNVNINKYLSQHKYEFLVIKNHVLWIFSRLIFEITNYKLLWWIVPDFQIFLHSSTTQYLKICIFLSKQEIGICIAKVVVHSLQGNNYVLGSLNVPLWKVSWGSIVDLNTLSLAIFNNNSQQKI